MTQDALHVFELPPALHDANAAASLIDAMRQLPAADEIHLDAAKVTSITPLYLQILISAFRTFPRLSVAEASDEFNQAFAAYGLAYPQALPQIHDEAAAAPSDEPAPAPAPPAAPGTECDQAAETAAAEPVEAQQMPTDVAPPPPTTDNSSTGSEGSNQTNGADMSHASAAKTILTIDDSRTMRDMLKMTLDGAGFTVLQAVDGQDGLSVLANQPVDLIITDINMPKLDGYGVIRAVRADPNYNSTPILVLSTEAEQESKDIAKDAGATGWIVKPFDPDGLVQLVNAVCA